ncbi:copper amine oxidase N-terminal domain-containing protein [Paenibacillus spiritus]|uniref:Copper amine oxidase N-terminal domain-containing protein n=1 Tax=Paenibacillus spiritus TaxID=2496557 RepID=A0A5J5GAX6_9BACL|nr:copper amine oxidase N-terminal domain-containing protein [Paenibacillus spiritus]KAA9004962.1 copper amine oxidase N-terminal domain-containing protein [Paenibacillus spiritus]
MKLLKFGLAAVLASTLSWFPSNSSFAAPAATTKSPVLLQINDYAVIYTYPKAPYLDRQQRLIVPLRAVSELLGASVTYDAELKQATIRKNGKELILTAKSNQILVDHVPKTMDTVPTIDQQSFLLPVRVLLDNLGLKGTRDSQTGILHVEEDAINDFPMIRDSKEWDLSADNFASSNGITATSYELTLQASDKSQLQHGSLQLSAQNRTGHSIPAGKEDLHLLFVFNNTYQMEADLNPELEQKRPRPALANGQVFHRTTDFAGANYGDTLKYIFAVGRVLK